MFRFSRLVNAMINPTDADAQRDAESELSAVRTGKHTGGFTIPAEAVASLQHGQVGERILSTATGAGAIETDQRGEDFIQSLLAENFVLSRARVYTGLNGTVQVPAESNIINAEWVGETQAPTEKNPTMRQITLSPKRIYVHTDVSRALLVMGNPDVEDLVKMLLTRVVARAIDHAAYYGTGQNNQPLGIANLTGSDANTDIALSTANARRGDKVWEALGEAEFNLATANVDENAVEAIIAPLLWYTMRFQSYDGTGNNDTKDSKLPILPERDSLLLEQYPQRKSGAITSGLFMADWSQVIIGQWTEGFELMVNPYILDTSGLVRLSVSTLADIRFEHLGAFQQITVN